MGQTEVRRPRARTIAATDAPGPSGYIMPSGD
jgi:hypothetical protein